MLQPARTKYRKMQKGRMRGKAYRGSDLHQGEFGLAATGVRLAHQPPDRGARVAITRYVKRGGKLWIRVYPDKTITKKPAETHMGTGKGPVEYYVAVVKPGRVLYELAGVDEPIELGHLNSNGLTPMRFLREFRSKETVNVGDKLTVEIFTLGDRVDVVGTSKG